MTVIECVVADTTGVVKMSAYNKTSFPMLQPGQSIMILNLICKPREVVLTSEAKVLLIPALEINEEILVSGEQLFNQMKNPTGAASKTILEILDLPPGTLVSCIVKVVEAEESQTVKTHYGSETDVRNGIIADHTAAIPFAFWRSLAGLPFSTDDCLKISGGIVSKTTDELPKISGNQQTVVEILPKDTVPVVKGTYRHEEEGEVVAVSNINIYSSYKRSACYNKKLNNNVCPKCNTKYPDGEEEHAIICSIGIQQNNDLSMVTLFTPQVKTLMSQTNAIEQKDSSRIEKELLDALPVKIGFTRSPVKDTNTLAKLKRL